MDMPQRQFIFGLLWFVTAAWPSVAQVPAEWKNDFERQRTRYRHIVLQFPLMEQHRMDQVFRIRRDGDEITVEPLIAAEAEYHQRRAELQGLPEPAIVVCRIVLRSTGQP